MNILQDINVQKEQKKIKILLQMKQESIFHKVISVFYSICFMATAEKLNIKS